MPKNLYSKLSSAQKNHSKKFAVLIDPDRMNLKLLHSILSNSIQTSVDFFFLGGSLVMEDEMDHCIETIKAECDIPIILFPGSPLQIHPGADAIFFLSVISGRNPELLIGNHVLAAPLLKRTELEIIPTGYMIVDGGASTTVSYMSQTFPIPADKDDIAAATAMAGEMLGLKVFYMDAGSGARNPISYSMVAAVRKNTTNPIIVGGGIRTAATATSLCKAGADVIVVGTAIEEDPILVGEISTAIHSIETVH